MNLPHYEKRNIVLKELKGSLRQCIEIYPQLELVLKDCDEFLENFYFDNAPKTLDIQVLPPSPDFLGFEINNKSSKFFAKGRVLFKGQGWWQYHFDVHEDLANLNQQIKSYFYEGMGDKMNIYSGNSKDSDYIFYLSDEINDFFEVPENYSKEYSPMFSTVKSSYRHKNKGLILEWNTGYYDGPLSGYCSYDNKFFYFNCEEEKDYSRTRLFSMTELTWREKIKATISHRLFEYSNGTAKYKKIHRFFNKYIYNKIDKLFIFPQDHFKNRPIFGYFES